MSLIVPEPRKGYALTVDARGGGAGAGSKMEKVATAGEGTAVVVVFEEVVVTVVVELSSNGSGSKTGLSRVLFSPPRCLGLARGCLSTVMGAMRLKP